MKTRILDHFGSGLFLLAVLTVAIVAGQAKLRDVETNSTDDIIGLNAASSIGIDDERIEKLEALLLRIRIDANRRLDGDIVIPDTTPVQ